MRYEGEGIGVWGFKSPGVDISLGGSCMCFTVLGSCIYTGVYIRDMLDYPELEESFMSVLMSRNTLH